MEERMTAQQRGEETRARLLDAAAAGFAEQGYDGTSVAEICDRAGVSKGAFYHHFASKQDLFLELLGRWLDVLDHQLEEMRSEEAAIPQQLLTMTEMIQHVFRAAEDQLPVFLEFWARATHDPAIWEATIAPYRRYRRTFAEMIETGVAEGTLRPVDADTTARVVVSLAIGVVVQGLLDTEGADWGEVAERGMEMLLEGIRKG
jgi:AcrR family transcriptional regulator